MIKTIDNRMEWYLKSKELKGVTMNWGGLPVLCDTNDKILPFRYDRIQHSEFYKDGNLWPICPITGKKIPLAKETNL